MIAEYVEIGQAIKDRVKAIKWIDIDKGQLDNPEAFNSIVVPGVLVGLVDIPWQQLGVGYQQGQGVLTVKTVFVLGSQTHLTDPLLSKALKQLALADDVTDAVLSVPGVTQRLTTKEYPSGTYYVVEETFIAVFKKSPTLTPKTVAIQINPLIVNPRHP